MRRVRTSPPSRPRQAPADAPFVVRAWVAEQLHCQPGDLQQIRTVELAPGVREVRYLRAGQSAVVATVARLQPGRYRVRAKWAGGLAEARVRGTVEHN